MKNFLLLTLVLCPAFHAFAEDLARLGVDGFAAKESIEKIQKDLGTAIGKDGTFVKDLHNRWVDKCDQLPGNEKRNCSLNECDFKEYFGEGCQSTQLLLLRGENRLREYPAISALARTHMQGSKFLEGLEAAAETLNVGQALLKQLQKELTRFGAIKNVSELSIVLSSESNGRQWFEVDEFGEALKPIVAKNEEAPLSTALQTYGLHVLGTGMSFFDGSLQGVSHYSEISNNVKSIDPLVSFSYSVWIPLMAAAVETEGNFGRIILLSIPKDAIVKACPPVGSDNFPALGSLWDASNCDISQSSLWPESEVDAILFPDAQYIVGSFKVPYGTEVNYLNFAD